MGSIIAGLKTPVDVTGVSATGSVGSVTVVGTATFAVSGVSATGSVGSITPIFIYSVSGVSGTSAVGTSVEVAGQGLVDDVTGVVLTSAVGSVIIIAWAEIDTGSTVTWTEIETAA